MDLSCEGLYTQVIASMQHCHLALITVSCTLTVAVKTHGTTKLYVNYNEYHTMIIWYCCNYYIVYNYNNDVGKALRLFI